MIPRETEGRILLDTKHGVILHDGKATPHEIPIYKGDPEGWDKRPNCPNCGGRMSETVLRGPSYSWYCPADECKDAHAAAFAIQHGKARAADIDTRPEKILPAYGVPAKYLAASLFTFDGSPGIRRAATAWAAEPAGNLYLWGGTGTGKTYLAAAILREYVKGARRTAYFRTVADLIRDIRATFDRDGGGDTEAELLDRYAGYGLLVFDDLGAENSTDFSTSTVLNLIDRRGNGGKATVITSNMTLSEISDRLDPRIASRLSEGQAWHIPGPDRRRAR